MIEFKTDINIRIETIKIEQQFDSYIETLAYYIEYESDQEPKQLVRFLNKKILEEIHKEANEMGMLKTQETIIGVV